MGRAVGELVGEAVSLTVGRAVGAAVGLLVGWKVGSLVLGRGSAAVNAVGTAVSGALVGALVTVTAGRGGLVVAVMVGGDGARVVKPPANPPPLLVPLLLSFSLFVSSPCCTRKVTPRKITARRINMTRLKVMMRQERRLKKDGEILLVVVDEEVEHDADGPPSEPVVVRRTALFELLFFRGGVTGCSLPLLLVVC